MTDKEIFLANVKLPVRYEETDTFNWFILDSNNSLVGSVTGVANGRLISKQKRRASGRFIAEAINKAGELTLTEKNLKSKTPIML